jgi:hypothetical protein
MLPRGILNYVYNYERAPLIYSHGKTTRYHGFWVKNSLKLGIQRTNRLGLGKGIFPPLSRGNNLFCIDNGTDDDRKGSLNTH